MPFTLATALLLLVAVGLTAAAALRAWNQWLELRRFSITGIAHAPTRDSGSELIRLKERVRRLEAIARGVDF